MAYLPNSDKDELVEALFQHFDKTKYDKTVYKLTRENIRSLINQYEALMPRFLGISSDVNYRWKIPYVGMVYIPQATKKIRARMKKKMARVTVRMRMSFNEFWNQIT